MVEKGFGNLPEARRLVLRAEQIYLTILGPNHANTRNVSSFLAELG